MAFWLNPTGACRSLWLEWFNKQSRRRSLIVGDAAFVSNSNADIAALSSEP